MALRTKRFVPLMFVLGVSATLLFLSGTSLLQSLAWNIRYGDRLREHKALVETYLRATHIEEVANKYPLKKWHVCKMFMSSQKPSIYMSILKFCPVDRVKDKERIIAWVNEQGEVVRYIWVCREPEMLHKDRLTAIELPIRWEAFQRKVEGMTFRKCCHASLLDIKNEKHGIQAYERNSQFYYEYEITLDLWLYWETDYEGNIVARGVHDSP